ncbi:MAG: transcriptional regulator [Elusimicrobia bacterium CG1_02_37_114]|nr:MAG: transcriptional regulator [Elusimicrobia bacterium CG1_02_37_114]PIV53063.1 MAG: YebC/PmpR family DNA-binding transcriptional regulator [Elusimicrobia bacterium CG02_land_8_20_14_3_00_37_13]PIZ13067.1 MAG: YebC/PmpR family DNA-binding transcriptional regulator [Elusimicrobia bacterium CG_4_10_14_0_8_um_filter_37_32]
MSGHSKWAGIKHHKMAQDAKRGQKFTKIIREISIAARQGGPLPENNPRLRKAIEQAHEANMPQDNVKKAVLRGTGELPGVTYEDASYEGYGPGGVAVLVEATTDNKNRTTNELRRLFSQYGGNLGESGCVAWMFIQRGYITLDKTKYEEEKIMTLALDLGVEDFKSDDEETYEITTVPEQVDKIVNSLKEQKIDIVQSEVTMLPKTYIKLAGKEAEQMLGLMNALEDHDDVNNVYANFDIPEEIMEKVSA